jgi:hypothetical protein
MLPLVDLYPFIDVEREATAIVLRMVKEVSLGHSEDGASKIGRNGVFRFRVV